MATDGRLEPYQEEEFPNLAATGYRITSQRSRFYNCFAWAAGENDPGGIRWNQVISTIGLMGCPPN